MQRVVSIFNLAMPRAYVLTPKDLKSTLVDPLQQGLA
jgi:hypothetical protein